MAALKNAMTGLSQALASALVVIAEVSPAKLFPAPPPSLVADLSRELARIHALPRAAIPAEIPVMDTAAALAELKARFLTNGGDRPAIALAIKWCEDHAQDTPSSRRWSR